MITELINQITQTHVGAGAAGGAVRGISRKDSIIRVALSILVGGVSAAYVAPVLIWGAGRYFQIDVNSIAEFNTLFGPFVGFSVGLVSMELSLLVECLISKGGNKK